MAFLAPIAASALATTAGTATAATALGAIGPVTAGASALGTLANFTGLSFGTVSAGASVLGTVGSVGNLFQLGGGLLNFAENEAIADYNKAVSERDAFLATQSAQIAADEERKENKRRISAITSAFSKGGVVTTAGSPLLTILEQAEEGELEAQKILYEGNIKANTAITSGVMASMKAKNTGRNSLISSIGNVLSSGSILSGKSTLV